MSLVETPVLDVIDDTAIEDFILATLSEHLDSGSNHTIDNPFVLKDTLTDAEAELITDVQLRPKDVGRVISAGAESVVREYKDDEVIKLPLGYISNTFKARILHAIVGQNFGQAQYEWIISSNDIGRDTVAHTQFFPGQDSLRFASVQKFRKLEAVEKQDLIASSELRSQMIELLKGNGRLYKRTKYAIDASGVDVRKICRGKPYVYNIPRDAETGKLCIIDTGLLDYQKHAIQILFQRWNMRRLGFDFFGREGGY